MKNFIVSILEPILSLFVVIYTLAGFIAGGFGLFGRDFNLVGALIGGFVFFLIAVVGTGAIFTLLTIRDLLEEQVELLEAKQNK